MRQNRPNAGAWCLALALALPAQGQSVPTIDASLFRVLVESSDLKREGDYDGALAMLEALDLASLSVAERALVRESLGNAYSLSGDFERATEHFRMVAEEPADTTVEYQNRIWYRLATASLQLDDYEEVLRVVQTWRDRVDPSAPNAHKILAFAHMKRGNRAAALAEAESYVATLRAAEVPIPSSFTRFLARARRPEGEMSDLYTTELTGLASPDVLRVLRRANEMIELWRFDKAAALLSETLETHEGTATDAALLREKLAWALTHQDDMAGAKEQFRKITVAPGALPSHMLDQIWMRLASTSYKAGAYEDALDSAENWQDRLAKPPALYFRIVAMAHLQLGNRASAIRYGHRYAEAARLAGEEIDPSFRALFGDVLGAEIVRELIRRNNTAEKAL